jgi:hypothetical protein
VFLGAESAANPVTLAFEQIDGTAICFSDPHRSLDNDPVQVLGAHVTGERLADGVEEIENAPLLRFQLLSGFVITLIRSLRRLETQ